MKYEYCTDCARRFYSTPIIGIEGQDVPTLVGKAFCNMQCADEYIKRKGTGLTHPIGK